MDTIDNIRKQTNGFSKLECSVCQRLTWHYKDKVAEVLPHCTEHVSKALEHAQKVIRAYYADTPIHIEPIAVEDTPAQLEHIAALEKKWRSGHGALKATVLLTDDWAANLFEPDNRPEDEVRCSFCDCKTDLVTATVGTGKLTIKTVLEESGTGIGGDISTHEKTVRTQEKVIACPKCVGNLKPKLDKQGNITRQAFESVRQV